MLWALVSFPITDNPVENHVYSSWHGSKMYKYITMVCITWQRGDPFSLKDRPEQEALGVGLDAKLLQESGSNNDVQPKTAHEQR